jgi:hypothetical protein
MDESGRFRIVATAFALSVALANAALAARPDVRAMTCDQGRSLIASSGQVVVTTGDNTFDRIVHNRGFCTPGQDTVLEIVKALDDPRCTIGYTCRDRANNN